MDGKVVVVTGANTGIGRCTAAQLASMGATVVLACRSESKTQAACQDIRAKLASPKGSVSFMQLDLGDLDSVRRFAGDFKRRHNRLDVLVNNAGLNLPGRTKDGLDQVFGVNFVGHFLLTLELMDVIKATKGARVINLSSVMHRFGRADWEHSATGTNTLPWMVRSFSSTYSDSKLAMILFTCELRRKFAAAGCDATAFSVNPGAVASDIWRHIPKRVQPVWGALMRGLFLTVDQGCFTSVATATLPLEQLAGSDYYQPYWLPFGLVHPFELMGPFRGCQPAEPATPPDDEQQARLLWDVCSRLVALGKTTSAGAATS